MPKSHPKKMVHMSAFDATLFINTKLVFKMLRKEEAPVKY